MELQRGPKKSTSPDRIRPRERETSFSHFAHREKRERTRVIYQVEKTYSIDNLLEELARVHANFWIIMPHKRLVL